jgi:hypothetical protein
VYQWGDACRRDASMPQQHLGPGINGHDGIERAGLGIDIELQEDFFDGAAL